MSKAQSAQSEGGNTKPLRVRSICITLNNYTDEEHQILIEYCKKTKAQYIIGKEIGAGGTKHLQGFIRWPNKKAFTEIKKINNRMHIEQAKGTINQNYKYCSKDNNFETNIEIKLTKEDKQKIKKEQIIKDEYENIKWKPWQTELLKKIDNKPDKRKIYFYVDKEGNKGKSFIVKYLALTRNVIICDGKKDNIFNQIKTAYDNDEEINIILCDVPRTNINFINYGAIEQIKNGCIYSGKYEGGQCIFKIPHVMIFMNENPDETALSQDRYEIINI